jgi:hypothetical protein
VPAHGTGSRPGGGVDLFTSRQRRGEFPELAAAVVAAPEAAGYKATVIMSAETFTRLILTGLADGSEEVEPPLRVPAPRLRFGARRPCG